MNPLMILGLVRRERINDLHRADDHWSIEAPIPSDELRRQHRFPHHR
jgi:hypothetical protein